MSLNRRAFLGTLIVGAVAVRTGWAADKKDHKDEGEWENLGERNVSKKEERDVIEVTGKHRYTAIEFRVEKGEIEMEDIKVTFGNDESWSADTKLVFGKGEHSRKIDLPGESRDIKRVRFLYRSVGKGEAKIVLLGKIGAGKK